MNKLFVIFDFLKFYFTQKKLVISLFIIILLSLILSITSPYLIKEAIDEGILKKDLNFLLTICIFLFLVYFLKQILSFYGMQLSFRLKYSYTFNLTNIFVIKIFNIDYLHIKGKKIGEIINYFEKDIQNISTFCQKIIFDLLINVVQIFGLLAFLFYLNVKLTIVAIISLLIYLIIIKISKRRIEYISRLFRKNYIKLNSFLYERLKFILKIKLLRRTENEIGNYNSFYTNFLKKFFPLNRFNILIDNSKELIGRLSILFLLVFGGILVIKGEITIGLLIAINTLFASLFTPASSLFDLKVDYHKTLISFQKIQELLLIKDEKEEDKDKLEFVSIITEVEFNNISFKYHDVRVYLFKNLNLLFK